MPDEDRDDARDAVATVACEWISQRDGRAGLVCGATTFIGAETWDSIEDGGVDTEDVVQGTGALVVCSKAPDARLKLLCLGVIYTVPPIVDVIANFITSVADAEATPPPTGTTTPESPNQDGDGSAVDHGDGHGNDDSAGQGPPTGTTTPEQHSGGEDRQSGGGTGAANSETAEPTTTTTPPVVMGPVTGLGGSADGNSVWLGWNAPASGPTPIAYRVLRAATGGAEQEVARVGGNAYIDRNLQSGVTYTYRVQAISGTLASPMSASTSVTIP